MTFLSDEFGIVSGAIQSGTFDPQGSNFTTFFSNDNPANTTHSQDNLTLLGTGTNNSGTPTITMGTSGNSSNNSSWLPNVTLPSFSDIIGGMTSGASSAGNAATSLFGISGATFQNYFARAIIVILGFIFVAAGLALFGVRTQVGQSVVREVRNSIPK